MFEDEIAILVYSAVDNAACSVWITGHLVDLTLQAADGT